MTRRWLVHYLAECQVCKWEIQDYINGPRKASIHARKTGHEVHAEAGYAIRYGEGKKVLPEKEKDRAEKEHSDSREGKPK